MRPDDIRVELQKQPFQPFRIHLSNGRGYDIRHPELVMVGKSTLVVGNPSKEYSFPVHDGYEVISLLHINNIERLPLGTSATYNGDTP